MRYLKSYNESTSGDFWKIPFTFDKPNLEIKKLFDYQGDPISMTEEEIKIVNEILEPIKSYDPGHHVHDDDYRRLCVQYPSINWKHTNSRSGYCWFLKEVGEKTYFKSTKYEVMINKFHNDYYIVNITDNWVTIHLSGKPRLVGINDYYIVDTIDELKRLLIEKVLPLYKNI